MINHTGIVVTLKQAVIIVQTMVKVKRILIKAFKGYTSASYARKNVYLVKSCIKKIPMRNVLSLYRMVQIGC